ncbi:MAG: hypothetical protein V1856_02140, partial [Candidatus Liptonbacteria bacterium]
MNKRISDFITIFLALAILSGTGAWFWSDRGGGAQRAGLERGVGKEEYVSENAFVKRDLTATEAAMDNLTYRLAESLAGKMNEYNAEGPGDAADPGIWQPTPEMVLEDFLLKREIYGPVVLDQAAILAKQTKPEQVNSVEGASQGERAAYLEAFAQIAQENIFEERVAEMVGEAATPETVSALAVTVGQSIRKLDELRVPKEYLGMHMATRDVLVVLDSMLGLPVSSTDDPVRVMLAAAQQGEILEARLGELQREFQSPELQKELSEVGRVSPVASSYFLGRANAMVPVFDPVNFSAKLYEVGKHVGEWIRKWITETLKDVLVHRLIQQTISWIQGNGKPKFVTNWKSFLGDVANQAAGDFLYRINPKLCTSFGPMIRISLTPVVTAPDRGITCTLDQVMSNVQEFYNNFNNGGWIAYGATLEPQNNFYGAYFQASDIMMMEQAEKREAAKSEAEAGSGFPGTKLCTRWEYRREPCPPGGRNPDGSLCSSAVGTLGTKVCAEEKTTTPGDMVAETLAGLPNAPLQRIVNAQDITALINALVNAAFSKLLSAAKNIGANSDGDPGVLGLNASALPQA